MSLETLLEAAEFLEKNNLFKEVGREENGARRANEDGESSSADAAGGHLLLDPNLPISFQFHTYSSNLSPPINGLSSEHRTGTNKRNANSTGRAKSASFSVSNRSAYSQQGSSSGNGTSMSRRAGRNASMSESGCSPGFTSSRHRELHKTLEKNRRAHLRSCFEQLKQELPKADSSERKYSHINIIHYAIKYIQQLKQLDNDQQTELRRLSLQNQRYLDTMEQLSEQIISRYEGNSPASSSTSSMNKVEYKEENMDRSLMVVEQPPMEALECEVVCTQRSPDHRRQMDALLLQVERTLLSNEVNNALEEDEMYTVKGEDDENLGVELDEEVSLDEDDLEADDEDFSESEAASAKNTSFDRPARKGRARSNELKDINSHVYSGSLS